VRLNGKVAIITGAGTGIGRATAILFCREMAKIVITGRNMDNLNQTLALAGKTGGEATALRADVSKAEDVKHLVDQTIARYGRLDILFNNAGVGYSSPFFMGSVVDTPEEDWIGVLNVNLKSIFLTTKMAIPHMLKNPGGSIINCSSINGVIGCGADAYSASKGGINALTRALAVEYGRYNIRVNTVSPGPTETPMIEKALEQQAFRDYWTNASPMRRIARPEEVAYTVLFLASDESSFITGQNILVDGGLTIS
jgi:NAD(P)-dependent dehydrogenase (short-subunit alcohol dehydrogenase family)